MSRLETIATRQRSTRLRDAFFALAIAAAAAVSVTSVAACQTSAPTVATAR